MTTENRHQKRARETLERRAHNARVSAAAKAGQPIPRIITLTEAELLNGLALADEGSAFVPPEYVLLGLRSGEFITETPLGNGTSKFSITERGRQLRKTIEESLAKKAALAAPTKDIP